MGGFRAMGPIWSSSPNNRSTLRWLILAENTVWVGLELPTKSPPPQTKKPPKEIRCILVQHFSLLHYCLFYWSANGCVSHRHGRDVADVFTVKWRSVITSQPRISAKLVPILLYFNTRPLFKSSTSWALSAPVLFIYFPASHLAKSLSWLRAGFQWWNVFLLFPFLSHRCLCLSAWGLWDCGRAALPWQQAVLPNCVHLGFGVSLHSLPLSYLFHLSLRFPLVQQRLSAPLSLSLSLSPTLCLHSLSHPEVDSHT